MKLGLLTAALPGMSLTEIGSWAAESGFGMLEVACWPQSKSDRRYGGVTHIDVEELDKAGAHEIKAMLADNPSAWTVTGGSQNRLANNSARINVIV